MSLLQYKTDYAAPKIQVITFTHNGFLIDTCHSVFNLTAFSSVSLLDSVSFLKKYKNLIKNLENGNKRFLSQVVVDWKSERIYINLELIKEENQTVCIIENITEIYKQLEGKKETTTLSTNSENAEVLALQSELDYMKKVRQIQQEYFAKITHDIKLPLTEIVGTTYILKNFVEGEKGKNYIRALSNSARGLDIMLNDLLNFSRSENYRFQLEQRTFTLESTLQSVITTFDFKTQQQNVPIHLYLDPEIPPYLEGDSTRLAQIIYNLLDNALKYTRKGKIELNVSLKNLESSNCMLLFQVKDTGIGIPKEKLKSVFKTYQQVDEDRDFNKGFGIGLSIVQQLVELQGGKISVDSQLGKGTVFTFKLGFRIGGGEA